MSEDTLFDLPTPTAGEQYRWAPRRFLGQRRCMTEGCMCDRDSSPDPPSISEVTGGR